MATSGLDSPLPKGDQNDRKKEVVPSVVKEEKASDPKGTPSGFSRRRIKILL